MNNLSRSHHLKVYLKLKQQECIIEKSIEAFMVNCKVDVDVWNGIKEDIDKFDNDRQSTIVSLKSKVTATHEELKFVRSMFDVGNVGKIDLPVFKTKLQSLWKSIEEFKNLQDAMNILVEEQNGINNDLNTLTSVIRKHKNVSSTDPLLYKTSNSNSRIAQKDDATKESDYKEAEDFCTLLAKTGHTGSWSDEDHLLFVNLRKRHRSTASLVLAIQAKCPDLTNENIVNHEAWYKTYLELREKQKLAVQEWRDRKESERRSKLAASKTSEEVVPSIFKIAEHKKEEVTKKKELVRMWREKREQQRIAEEERTRDQLRARKKMRENQRKARTERLKHLVEEYKKSKVVQKEEVASEAEKEQAMMNALSLRFYRAKDQEFVEKRRSALSSKKTANEIKSVESHFKRVYCESTLLKETKAWQEKLKKNESFAAYDTLSYIKNLPSRSLVNWQSYEISGSFTSRQR